MSTPRDPSPLTSADDAIARLLRDANSTYATPIDEARAWRRLESTYNRRQEIRQSRYLYLSSALLVGAVGWVVWHGQKPPREPLRVEADPAVIAVAPKASDKTQNKTQNETQNETHERARLESSASVGGTIALSHTISPPSKVAGGPAATAGLGSLGTSGSGAAASTPDCSQSSLPGNPAERGLCLELASKGSDLRAEQALVELATLKSQSPSQRASALRLLDDYKARFPAGALRGEVDFKRVDLLSQLGEYRRAFAESEALLRTAWGRTRSSELHLLRGRIAQDELSDCASAISEFAYVKNEFGKSGDDASFRTAQCQDADGNQARAAQAYREYLARPSSGRDPSRAARASARLRELEK